MTENSAATPDKILIIRMLSTADVCAVALPVIRLYQQRLPNAEIHLLTFAQGGQLINMTEPSVKVQCLASGEWPDDFFLAMETFLGLAEQIIGEEYSQIVNLDTAFMPCFLSRFLKDALEPVSGNYLSLSVQSLLSQVENQSLQADYVNNTASYLASTFSQMYKWQGSAWQYGQLPDGGYPEYYLTQCCGLDVSSVPVAISVVPDKRLTKKAQSGRVIGLCLSQSDDGYLYPFSQTLRKQLEQVGYQVWQDTEAKDSVTNLIKMLGASDLMVTKPSGDRWYAQAVNCPVLLISGDSEPAIFMPDFATETAPRCARHTSTEQLAADLLEKLPCSCDGVEDLVESILSIFAHLDEEQSNG
jgi:ADP-heptose:LPS heptosyltransferase